MERNQISPKQIHKQEHSKLDSLGPNEYFILGLKQRNYLICLQRKKYCPTIEFTFTNRLFNK